jgi:peptidoglycan/xylan/chitin deacetylase (PgdA/CDA1 family)
VRAAVILMYHRLGSGQLAQREPGEHLYAVTPEDFEGQLETLTSGACTPGDVSAVSAGGEGPRNPVAITFDDGNASDHSVALPALARRRLPAAFFVTPAWVGSPGYMDWSEIRELAEAGMTVGAHGLEHVPLSSLSADELKKQLAEARRVIEARISRPVEWLALPGGFGGSREVQAAREVGFRSVLGSVPQLARSGASGEPIPRFSVRRGQSLASFRALVEQRRPALLRYWLRHVAIAQMRSLLGSRGHARLREAWLKLGA